MSSPGPGRPASRSTLSRILRAVLPPPLYRALRTVAMNLFTPTVYAAQHGYYRSARQHAVVDASGAAAPWMTFPLLTFLETKCFAGRSVLEFGSGHSSQWWGERADHVFALETDPEWTKLVRRDAPANVRVEEVPLDYDSQADFAGDVHALVGDKRFDVVVVDGGDRVKALFTAPSVLTDNGFIVVDDLDLFREDPDWAPALAALFEAGFGCIDFYGLAVSAPFSRDHRCTSIFFRDGSFVTSQVPSSAH